MHDQSTLMSATSTSVKKYQNTSQHREKECVTKLKMQLRDMATENGLLLKETD